MLILQKKASCFSKLKLCLFCVKLMSIVGEGHCIEGHNPTQRKEAEVRDDMEDRKMQEHLTHGDFLSNTKQWKTHLEGGRSHCLLDKHGGQVCGVMVVHTKHELLSQRCQCDFQLSRWERGLCNTQPTVGSLLALGPLPSICTAWTRKVWTELATGDNAHSYWESPHLFMYLVELSLRSQTEVLPFTV